MTDLNLNELRKVAEAATPGPWTLIGGGEYLTPIGLMVAPDDGGVWPEDATHIATFDPPTVLALLDRVAELEAKEARVESLRQAAEVVVLDAGDEAIGPEPDPNLAELAHCVAALAGENTTGCPCCDSQRLSREAL